MSQGRYISLRLNADNYSHKAQFCFDQKDWVNALIFFKKSINETRQIPRMSLNKDDYLLLALARRDMVWPGFKLGDVAGAFECFHRSLRWFSKAVSGLTEGQQLSARYKDVFSTYYPILVNVLRRLKPSQLTLENKQMFDALVRTFVAFAQEIETKFPQWKITGEWEQGLRWPSMLTPARAGLFGGQIMRIPTDMSRDVECMHPKASKPTAA